MRKKGETLTKTYNRVYLYIFIVVIFSITLTQNYLIKPVLRDIQINEDVENMVKIRSVVTAKLDFLNGIVADNSDWDIMARAIEEKNIRFMESGYDREFLESVGGCYLSLHDEDLKMLYSTSTDRIKVSHAKEIKKEILDYYDKKTSSLGGLTTIGDRHYYYSVGKITDGSSDEYFGGVFLLIKKIDNTFIESISKELGNEIEIDNGDYDLDILKEIKVEGDAKKIYMLKSSKGINNYILRYNYKNLGKDDVINLKVTLDSNNKEYVKIFNYRIKVMLVIFLVVIIVLNYILKKYIVGPVANLSEKMNRFLTNQDNYLVNVERKEDEISILMNNYDTLIHMIDEREKRLKNILYVDSLTGVGTRRVLDERLEEYFNEAKEKEVIAIGMIDIDCFKRYNDNYGHQKGDEVLKRFGELLIETFDMEEDLIIRYGGEEFIVVSKPNGEDEFENKIRILKEKVVKEQIEHSYSLDKGKIISFSCGVVKGIPKSDETSQVFIKKADEKLYTAKDKGRNTIVF